MSARTLREIRRGAPEQDRNGPALAPLPRPQRVLAPRTLNELRKVCREFGRPAAREAEWGCVTVWLMNMPPQSALTNSHQVAILAVLMVREFDRCRFGWPHHEGKEWPPSRLDFLSPDVRQEALRVAAETLSDWRKAGRPHLGPDKLKLTYQYLTSCPAFIDKYIKEKE